MLIILRKSPFTCEYKSLTRLIFRAFKSGEDVAVLCIQNACIAVTLDKFMGKVVSSGIEVFALKEDCERRGLSEKVMRGVKIVDYTEWVSLVMNKHNKIVSWT